MTRAQSAKKIKKSKILISCRVYPKNKKEIETQLNLLIYDAFDIFVVKKAQPLPLIRYVR